MVTLVITTRLVVVVVAVVPLASMMLALQRVLTSVLMVLVT